MEKTEIIETPEKWNFWNRPIDTGVERDAKEKIYGSLKYNKIITIIGILNALRKEIVLLGGSMKLCSLKHEIIEFFKQNRLDQMFHIYKDVETAKRSELQNYAK